MAVYKIKRFASLASHVKNGIAAGTVIGGTAGTISGGPIGTLAGGAVGAGVGAVAGMGTKLGEMTRNGIRRLRGRRRVAESDYLEDQDNYGYED